MKLPDTLFFGRRRGCLSILVLAGWVAGAPAAVRTWTGAVNRDWFDPGNWHDGASQPGIPQAGDTVWVSSGSVLLTNETAALAMFYLGGATLTVSNWVTALQAADVVIGNGGLLTLPNAFSTAQMSNRIWVLCGNITVETGGTVSADARGYTTRMGPGAGGYGNWGRGSGGGGHGGKGGLGDGPGGTAGGVYGSVIEPATPGSGGGHHTSGSIGWGGGVIRIEASGTVTLNGTVSASGGNGSATPAAGAGGSIHISCHTFAGDTNGLLRARGGNASGTGGGGGGGRIAVHYVMAAPEVGVRFEVAGGSGSVADRSDSDAAQMGSLYLSDTNAIPELWRDRIRGGVLHVPGFTNWVSAVLVSNAFIGLPDTFDFNPSELTVASDAGLFLGANQTLSPTALILMTDSLFRIGTNSVLTYGGNLTVSTNAVFRMLDRGWLDVSGPVRVTAARAYVEASREVNLGSDLLLDRGHLVMGTVMQCGGDMRLLNGSTWTVYSAMTNAGEVFSGTLGVTGEIFVGAGSWIYPHAHSRNGGTVRFTAQTLTIETNAGFNANARGFECRHGPGRGGYGNWEHGSGGGGHGGKGGLGAGPGGSPGATYGSTGAPLLPGSGGGHYTTSASGYGGGGIRIDVLGRLLLRGAITANGGNGSASPAAGAGGAIHINCGAFYGLPGAVVQADGGHASGTGGGGGGGRIAIWVNVPEPVYQRYLAGIPGRVRRETTHRAWLGTLSATNGTGWLNPDHPDAAYPGTAFFYTYPHGTVMMAR